jgi:TRAP-type C4-dicarboxylate transport system permease small subunit
MTLRDGGMVALRTLRWIAKAIDHVVVALCAGFLLAISVVVVVSVYYRYVLNNSLIWSEEACRYMTVWLIFLGLSTAHRRGQHVSVGSVLNRLPARLGARQRVPDRVAEAITFIVSFVLTWLGAQNAASNFDIHPVTPALHLESAWVYLAIPVGFGLLLIQSLVHLTTPAPATVNETDRDATQMAEPVR